MAEFYERRLSSLTEDRGDDEVVFVEDGLDTSKAAHRLIITVLAAVAEMESENNAEQVRAGMEQAAREGHWQGGPVPLGLRINDDGDLDMDPIPSEAIQKATDFILSGRTTREAADREAILPLSAQPDTPHPTGGR